MDIQEKLWHRIPLAKAQEVTQLIKEGADPKKTREDGYSLLHEAAAHNNHGAIGVLSDAGAAINAATQRGFTPLMAAADGGSTDAVKKLIELGADVLAVNKDYRRASAYAAHAMHHDLAFMLRKEEHDAVKKLTERIAGLETGKGFASRTASTQMLSDFRKKSLIKVKLSHSIFDVLLGECPEVVEGFFEG